MIPRTRLRPNDYEGRPLWACALESRAARADSGGPIRAREQRAARQWGRKRLPARGRVCEPSTVQGSNQEWPRRAVSRWLYTVARSSNRQIASLGTSSQFVIVDELYHAGQFICA